MSSFRGGGGGGRGRLSLTILKITISKKFHLGISLECCLALWRHLPILISAFEQWTSENWTFRVSKWTNLGRQAARLSDEKLGHSAFLLSLIYFPVTQPHLLTVCLVSITFLFPSLILFEKGGFSWNFLWNLYHTERIVYMTK